VAVVVTDLALASALVFAESGSVDSQLRDLAAQVNAHVRVSEGKVTYEGGALPHETREGSGIDVALIRRGGVLLSTPNEPFASATLAGFADRVTASGRPILADTTDDQGARRRLYASPVPGAAGQGVVVVASTPLAEMRSSLVRSVALIVLLSLATVIASALLTYWLVGRALQPVSQIAALAETLSERDLHRRVEVDAPDDEVGELARTFNRMLGRLEASFQALRNFTSDASHELRSPLTLMGTEAELSLSRPRSPDEYRRTLEVLQAEIGHMTQMVDRLLLLARADAGDLQVRRERIDLVDFLHEAAARWQAVAERRGIEIHLEVPEAGTALADEGLTRRALDNLVDNAIRHSGGRTIVIRARPEAGTWLVQIMDRGPGIPPELRAHVFERFGKTDKARVNEGTTGAGLGLSLSLAFMRAQGGDLRLGGEPGWGAVFELRLPR
jgi:two-component system OmpR family sensor kinase